MDPLALFHSERESARQVEDPMAQVCTVANVDEDGQPHLRTLVLREIDGQLAIFVNATSPKWPHLQGSFALHTYWPTQQIQYRMRVTSTPIDNKIVHGSWQMRPAPPKRMDWFYEQHAAQSGPIASREALLAKAERLEMPDPLHAPDNARGLFIRPQEIERLDLTQPDGIHDRVLFNLDGSAWISQVLVP